jgi:AsmA-like C-terminal region
MDIQENNSPAVQPAKRPFSIFRFLGRFFLSLFIFLVLLIGGGVVVGYYYQDEVKEFVIGELNKQLNTEIIVDGKDIDFTVLKNFPYASVDFKNVKALDAIPTKKKDTLFTAKSISFQFNVWDVFKKNYRVKKIAMNDVNVRVRIDKAGNDNYHFWKQSADTAATRFSFALEKIELKNVHLSYKDSKSKKNIDVLINNSDLSGNFSDKEYALESTTHLFVNTIKVDSTRYLTKKNIHAEVALNIDNATSSYKITTAKVKIEDVLVEVFGNIITANDQPLVNLGVRGKDMNIQSVLSFIPAKYKGKINEYESDGEFYLDATIQGSLAANQSLAVVADFGIKNANIKQVKDDVVLHNVNLKGHYSNGNKNKSEPSVLTLMPFSATIEQGAIAGELSLRNLDNPSFNAKIKANFNLEELQRFIKLDTIETVTGKLNIDATFSGDGKNIASGNYENVTTSGDLALHDLNVKLKNSELNATNINGEFKFDNNDLAVNSFAGNIGKSDVELTGFFRNMIGYVLKENQDITVEATFHSKNIDLNEMLANKGESAGPKSKYKLQFSEHINLNLNSEIEHLVFRKFDATNIKGVIKLKDKKMIVDPIILSTMGGSITTSGLIDGSDTTKLLITCFSDVNRINITKMFESFENFGQTAITDKNLKGVTTAKIQFASVLTPELDMDMDKLYAGVDMTIENGEMNNVESMKSLSRFIELKDLESIHFSTLKNQIEIKNQTITIPKMEVKSSALNIMASGTHTFNNEINYKLKLSLNELLSKKAKQAKKENDEFGEVADDGLGRTNLFISMTGTIDHPIIRYDSKSAIQNIKQDLKVEKQTLKTILKDEFGLFKKDSTLNAKTPKEDTKFTIKWDEANKKEEKKVLKAPKKKEEDDF